jgi:hypothetical protein
MGSAAGVEWLRRRDSSESVKTDLEVWAKVAELCLAFEVHRMLM